MSMYDSMNGSPRNSMPAADRTRIQSKLSSASSYGAGRVGWGREEMEIGRDMGDVL
jgi:hypothetical protein